MVKVDLKRRPALVDDPRTRFDGGGAMSDEWHIRIDKRYVDPEAGGGARAKAEELAAGKGGVRRFFERAFDVHTDDRSWRRGAVGEERVAALLARKLDERWTVIHDLTIGSQGANLDHLVIGPAGVFALNTKHLAGQVTVYERAILHNGTNYRFLPKARDEARRVSQRLSAATGRAVPVQSVLVWTGPAQVTVKGRPADVRSMPHGVLPRYLRGLPQDVVSAGDALRIERAARDLDTWRQPPRTKRPPATTPAPPPSQSPPARSPAVDRPPPAGAGAATPAEVSVQRWQRYGKDRQYANGADGARLGFIDVPTGAIHLEVADLTGDVTRQLRAGREAIR